MPEAVLGIQAEDDLAPQRSVTMRDVTPAASTPAAAVAALIDNIEQDADAPAPAVSDAVIPPAAEPPPATTGAHDLPLELRDKARAIVTAIRAARELKEIDRILAAQRATLDAIEAVSPDAVQAILSEANKRVAEVVE